MIDIAMLTGQKPLPTKTATGRKHIPEGYSTAKSGGTKECIRQKAAQRRDYIVQELLMSGPMTAMEIVEFTEANANICAEDMKVLIASGRVKKRMHKAENLYWAAQ